MQTCLLEGMLTSQFFTVVWAIDQDSPDGLSSHYLSSRGDMTNRNGFQAQKAVLQEKQRAIQRIGVWSPCAKEKDRTCPPGFHHNGIVGHGNVYDFDDHKEQKGCHGKLNRNLCIANGIIGVNCEWNRAANGVRKYRFQLQRGPDD